MATQTLANAVTADGAQTGLEHTGPCSLLIHDDSIFGGAKIRVQIADTDTAADYTTIAILGEGDLRGHDIAGRGMYFLRVKIEDASSTTSLTVKTTQ